MSEAVERSDTQGLLASGYDRLDYASFFFLQVVDSPRAQAWLRSVVHKITTAEHPGKDKPKNCLNIALTYAGIRAFGPAAESIDGFSYEFMEGMNRPEAAQALGDTGPSAQKEWQFGTRNSQERNPIHLLALLYAENEQDLSTFAKAFGLDPPAHGLGLVHRENTSRRHGDRTEPFGFKDGISQPGVVGLTRKPERYSNMVKAGEFILGYEDEKGIKSRIPSLDNWKDPNGYLAAHPDCPDDCRAFGLNGSYLVFRKLSQDVKLFWNYAITNSRGDANRQELIAAKLMGRWRSGAPLVLSPEKPGAGSENDFLYMPTDPDGLACPIGSHIRRANPRDSLPTWPSRSIEISNRHRIIRRGRKYRVPPESLAGLENAEAADQGICFIALNADLLRQFEFIQNTWLNSREFNRLDDDRDPIVGDNNGCGQFTIQAEPVNYHLKALPRFVTMKGGGYFFLPGIRALRFLANC